MWGLLPRSVQISVFVALVVYSGWAISQVSQLVTGMPLSPLKSTGPFTMIIGTLIVGGFALFWRIAWRWIPALSHWFPDLTGRWEGEYLSSYQHANGEQATGSFKAVIRQGLFTSTITAWTVEMTSASIRSWLEADRDAQRFTIGYTYRSVPNAAVRDRSTPHDGVCFLTLHPDSEPECLKGTYHTERRTIGDLVLRRVSKEPGSPAPPPD